MTDPGSPRNGGPTADKLVATVPAHLGRPTCDRWRLALVNAGLTDPKRPEAWGAWYRCAAGEAQVFVGRQNDDPVTKIPPMAYKHYNQLAAAEEAAGANGGPGSPQPAATVVFQPPAAAGE
jgi:hypothetical protein